MRWFKITPLQASNPPKKEYQTDKMFIGKFTCNKCGKVFDKILKITDKCSVTCSSCGSDAVKRVFAQNSHATKSGPVIPAGSLFGGLCKTFFSKDD